MDANRCKSFVDNFWSKSALPNLTKFVSIPSKNTAFDPDWQKNGNLMRAAKLLESWIKEQNIPGTRVEILSHPGRTPFVLAEIAASPGIDKTIVFYGHLDKMPEAEGWSAGKGPWQPVVENDRLYGRGAADNGSGSFIAMTAVKAVCDQGLPHARFVFLLEACEENGSPDFDAYLESATPTIGNPDLFICLDSGGADVDKMWITNSLRGSINGTLSVEMLTHSIHSGSNGGLVASTFRIIRQLLSRIENEKTGEILLPELRLGIPAEWKAELKTTANIIGKEMYAALPLIPGAQPTSYNPEELLTSVTWMPVVNIIGAAGLPSIEQAGNNLRPATSLQLNVRIPPHANAEVVAQALKRTFEKDPPYGAKVTFSPTGINSGWSMTGIKPWLKQAITDGAKNYFANNPVYKGEGGAIGIIATIAQKYPQIQIVITGALAADSNCHGPDESLYIPLAKKLASAVAHIIATHAQQK